MCDVTPGPGPAEISVAHRAILCLSSLPPSSRDERQPGWQCKLHLAFTSAGLPPRGAEPGVAKEMSQRGAKVLRSSPLSNGHRES